MRERLGIVSTADAQTMTTGKRDLNLAFVRSRTRSFARHWAHNLDRQEIGGIINRVTPRKARVLQPVEYLIGVHIVAPRNLRNRNTKNPRLRTNHALLARTPTPTLPALRHTQNPDSVHLNKRTLNLTNDLWQSSQAGRLPITLQARCKNIEGVSGVSRGTPNETGSKAAKLAGRVETPETPSYLSYLYI